MEATHSGFFLNPVFSALVGVNGSGNTMHSAFCHKFRYTECVHFALGVSEI